jgi:hypothetical protein
VGFASRSAGRLTRSLAYEGKKKRERSLHVWMVLRAKGNIQQQVFIGPPKHCEPCGGAGTGDPACADVYTWITLATENQGHRHSALPGFDGDPIQPRIVGDFVRFAAQTLTIPNGWLGCFGRVKGQATRSRDRYSDRLWCGLPTPGNRQAPDFDNAPASPLPTE